MLTQLKGPVEPPAEFPFWLSLQSQGNQSILHDLVFSPAEHCLVSDPPYSLCSRALSVPYIDWSCAGIVLKLLWKGSCHRFPIWSQEGFSAVVTELSAPMKLSASEGYTAWASFPHDVLSSTGPEYAKVLRSSITLICKNKTNNNKKKNFCKIPGKGRNHRPMHAATELMLPVDLFQLSTAWWKNCVISLSVMVPAVITPKEGCPQVIFLEGCSWDDQLTLWEQGWREGFLIIDCF